MLHDGSARPEVPASTIVIQMVIERTSFLIRLKAMGQALHLVQEI